MPEMTAMVIPARASAEVAFWRNPEVMSRSIRRRRASSIRWQVALAWVMARPGVTSTIIGASTLAQLHDNI